MASADAGNYWLERYIGAVENAAAASGERARSAYLDLADHYWSMHLMVHGRSAPCAAYHIRGEILLNRAA